MSFKRIELFDGTTAVINAAHVTWLEPRDTRTTRVHFTGGSATVHVKGSVTEVARQLSSTI